MVSSALLAVVMQLYDGNGFLAWAYLLLDCCVHDDESFPQCVCCRPRRSSLEQMHMEVSLLHLAHVVIVGVHGFARSQYSVMACRSIPPGAPPVSHFFTKHAICMLSACRNIDGSMRLEAPANLQTTTSPLEPHLSCMFSYLSAPTVMN